MLDIGLLPQGIRRYAEGSDVSALKLNRRSSVYRIAGSDGAYCLKIAHARERLQREADMLRFLARGRLAPQPVCFESDEEREYLLMEIPDMTQWITVIWRIQPSFAKRLRKA